MGRRQPANEEGSDEGTPITRESNGGGTRREGFGRRSVGGSRRESLRKGEEGRGGMRKGEEWRGRERGGEGGRGKEREGE